MDPVSAPHPRHAVHPPLMQEAEALPAIAETAILVAGPAVGAPEPSRSLDLTGDLADDHDRIAASLSDGLIHQMFAISLDMHAALALVGRDHHAAGKIANAIHGLDQAITGLRLTIYDLQPPPPSP